MRYAAVAVNAPVQNTFHYHIPPELENQLVPGHLVRVGFGTAMQPGIVVGFDAESPFETRPILELLDPEPVMTYEHIDLAMWMSHIYLTPPGFCLWLMLPPGLTGKNTRRVTLLQENVFPSDSTEALVIELLKQKGAMLQKALEQAAGVKSLRKTLTEMAHQGVVRVDSVLSTPTVKPKMVRTIRLAPDWDTFPPARTESHRRIVTFLEGRSYVVDADHVYEETGTNATIVNTLVKKGILQTGERHVWRDSLADRDFISSVPLRLTAAQRQVWEVIRQAIETNKKRNAETQRNPTPDVPQNPLPTSPAGGGGESPAPSTGQGAGGGVHAFLLHGVTGSGKTEIYLYAIERTLAQGRQAIFLVPEIALTPQTIRRVAERFPGQVAVVHGSLSQGERYDTWRRARAGEIDVIVGTRSALFTPLPDIGLIILDEEHDHSYKHQPPFNPPYYHARAVAEEMMRLNDGVLILGSATPELETFHRAERGDLQYLHLPGRIMGHRTRIHEQSTREGVTSRYRPAEEDALTIDLPPVKIVDMRDELKANNRSIFSRALILALAESIMRREQAILFLNRRGQSTYVFCRDCGYVAACKRCDMPMTYHRTGEVMTCHHCGSTQPVPTTCPQCSSSRIKFFGAGTQQVEDELLKLFPDVRCIRWDADTADKPEMHEAILAQFIAHEADVMVGTQMIAKGLDLPLVTLVGVVNADPGLALPDFRANERTFQLLTQVAGRAGRGILGGQVIVQTYQPNHESIQAAAQHDYERFYNHDITARRNLGYPPFRRLARLLLQSTHPVNVQREAEEAAAMLRQRIAALDLTDTTLIGPAPCFFSRIDRHYRWHVLLRSPNPLPALENFPLRPGWSLDIDPVDVL